LFDPILQSAQLNLKFAQLGFVGFALHHLLGVLSIAGTFLPFTSICFASTKDTPCHRTNVPEKLQQKARVASSTSINADEKLPRKSA
jgi:hypothetical protein